MTGWPAGTAVAAGPGRAAALLTAAVTHDPAAETEVRFEATRDGANRGQDQETEQEVLEAVEHVAQGFDPQETETVRSERE